MESADAPAGGVGHIGVAEIVPPCPVLRSPAREGSAGRTQREPRMATVTFHGACGVVTGSSTRLDWGERRILVDCGMYQGDEELEQRNRAPFPYRPSELSAVVVTHAHLDHTGLLPRLVAEGYSGPIYCTAPSRGLISLVLQDAGEIQEEAGPLRPQEGVQPPRRPAPLYTERGRPPGPEAAAAGRLRRGARALPGRAAALRPRRPPAGGGERRDHRQGADGEPRTWCFSGDVGRYGVPILKDPEPPAVAARRPAARIDLRRPPAPAGGCDRGPGSDHRRDLRPGRRGDHPRLRPRADPGDPLPPLALAEAGRLDPATVFLDSPMAIDATEIYDSAPSPSTTRSSPPSTPDPLGAGRFRAAAASRSRRS